MKTKRIISFVVAGVMLVGICSFLGGCSDKYRDKYRDKWEDRKEEDGFYYYIKTEDGEKTAVILGLVDEEAEREELVIPEKLGGQRVSQIGYLANYWFSDIKYYGIKGTYIKRLVFNYKVKLYDCGIMLFEGTLIINADLDFKFTNYNERKQNGADYELSLENIEWAQFNIEPELIDEYETFTARLTMRRHYLLEFDAMGGEQQTYSIVVKKENLLSEPTIPSKQNCIFNGWFIEEELTTKWNFEEDKVSDNMTLYAKWIEE
jgi:uncharacterized repeat protein (TIGR02543 family)